MDSVGEAAAGALAAIVAARWQASARHSDTGTTGAEALFDADPNLRRPATPAGAEWHDAGDLAQAPAPRLIRTPADAEQAAAAYMRWLGHGDAHVTPAGADGGLDVVSAQAVAQVKMEGVRTSRPTVQALYGVAQAEGKRGLFFSLGGYTREAVDWANQPQVRLPLWQFDLQGTPRAMNPPAMELVAKAHSPTERARQAAADAATLAERQRDERAERAYAELVAAVAEQRQRERERREKGDARPVATAPAASQHVAASAPASSQHLVTPTLADCAARKAAPAPQPSQPPSAASAYVPGEEYQPSLDAPVLVWLARLGPAEHAACRRQATQAAQPVRDALMDPTSDEHRALLGACTRWARDRLLSEVQALSPPSRDPLRLPDQALRDEYLWLFAEHRYRVVYEQELGAAVVLAGVRRCMARATADPPAEHVRSGCDHATPAYRRQDVDAMPAELRSTYAALLRRLT